MKKNISFQETHLHESICHNLLELLLINVHLQPHLFCRGRQGSRRASNSWRVLSYRWPWRCRLPHLTGKHVTSTPPWHCTVEQQTSQQDWYRYKQLPLSQSSGIFPLADSLSDKLLMREERVMNVWGGTLYWICTYWALYHASSVRLTFLQNT
jgi:hypothetical protein